MNIDEAIEHAREKANEQRYYTNFEHNGTMHQSCIKCAEEHEQLADWLEQLKEYKDLEEQGRLVKLPCNVGGIVYRMNVVSRKTIEPLRVIECRFKVVGNYIREKICCSDDILRKQPNIIYYAEDIGNKVFLTKAEAEAKLKEMR